MRRLSGQPCRRRYLYAVLKSVMTQDKPDTDGHPIRSVISFGPFRLFTLKNGRVEQANFGTYPLIRIDEAPVVEKYLVKSSEAPGGIGRAATAAVGPAVTNAIFAATGKRIRSLPIDTSCWEPRADPRTPFRSFGS